MHERLTSRTLFSLFDGESSLIGRYGTQIPSEKDLVQLRSYLSERIRKAMMDWAGEKVFLRCFVQAAAVFVALFYLFSIAIRDPLPILDEFIVSLLGSMVLFFFSRKRYYRRLKLEGKIQDYTDKMAQIMFHRSPLLEAVELILDLYDELPTAELEKYLRHEDPRCKFDFDKDETMQFFRYLENEVHEISRKKSVILQKKLWSSASVYRGVQDLPLLVIHRQLKFWWKDRLADQEASRYNAKE